MSSTQKIHLHFVSSIVGSIFEITNDLSKPFSDNFILTREWKGEIPEKKEVLLCHFLDPIIVKSKIFKEFKLKILIQPIDGTSIINTAVELFNKFDLIICPAEASKRILELNGVKTSIQVIPNFYKDDILENTNNKKILKYIPEDAFVIYHESTFHDRKGIELLYESYVKAFSDINKYKKVLLVLKDMEFNSYTFERIEKLKRKTIALQETYRTPAKIIKFSNDLSFSDLKTLWHRSNMYVSFAKIEGFGIPLLRQYILKKPILVLENFYSGYHDFLLSNTTFVKTKQIETKDEGMWLYDNYTKWAIPRNEQDLIISLKKIVDENLYLKKEVVIDSNYDFILKSFNFKEVSKKYIETIYQFYQINFINK